MTCGNPRSMESWTNPSTGKLEALGCYCSMWIKGAMKEVDCFLYERLGKNHIGWTEPMNGSYAKRNRTNPPAGDHTA